MLIRRPPHPLGRFVDRLWYAEQVPAAHARERLLPTGTVELVVSLSQERIRLYQRDGPPAGLDFPAAVICGPHSEYFLIDAGRRETVAGVHFRPGGAWPFLTLPADRLHNTHLDLESLWGRGAELLRERLLEAGSPDRVLGMLETVLLEQLARPLSLHPAVEYALGRFAHPYPGDTIAAVTDRIGLSSRRFIDLFRGAVGLTPKLYCRIRRFQQVLTRVEQGRPLPWPAIAASCGFYDQAHFIRDFQAFSGLNPSDYLTRRGDRLNHIPLAD